MFGHLLLLKNFDLKYYFTDNTITSGGHILNRAYARPLKIYVYYCSGSFEPETLNRNIHGESGDEFKMIGLPCSGKADILYLIKSFETGADGVVLLTCAESKCRYLEGNLRASRRIEEVNSLFEETGIETRRVMNLPMGEGGIADVVSEINIFCKNLRNMAFHPDELNVSEPVLVRC